MSYRDAWIQDALYLLPDAAPEVFISPQQLKGTARQAQQNMLDRVAEALYDGDDAEVGRIIAGDLRAQVDSEIEAAKDGQS